MLFWIGLAAILLIMAIYAFKKSRSEEKNEVANRPRKRRADDIMDTDFDDEDDEFEDDYEDDEFVPVWETKDFRPSKDNRPKGFVGLPGRYDINLSGTNRAERKAAAFIKAADPIAATLVVERQPDNPHDPNAMLVIGSTGKGAEQYQLGFIPAEIAAELTNEFGTDMPIGAELRRGGFKRGENACFIAVNLTGPGAAERRKYQKS